MLKGSVAVFEPDALHPRVTLTRGPTLHDRSVLRGPDEPWSGPINRLLARNDAPAAVVVLTEPGGPSGAQALVEQLRAEASADTRKPWLSAPTLLDAGTCRGLAEARLGAGADLPDHLHLGCGVAASGVQIAHQWRRTPSGHPWSAASWWVGPSGFGAGTLAEWNSRDGLMQASSLMGVELTAPTLRATDDLRPFVDEDPGWRPLTDAVLDDAAKALAVTLGGLINVLDCADVVLHAYPSELFDGLTEAIDRHVQRYSFQSLRQGLRWHRARLGADAATIGAALEWTDRYGGRQ